MFPGSGPCRLPAPPDVYTGFLTHFHMKSRHFPLKPSAGVMGCCVKGKNYNEEIFLITASDYKGMQITEQWGGVFLLEAEQGYFR